MTTTTHDVSLRSGSVETRISPATGKITHLLARGENLLVEPLASEVHQALSADGRMQFTSLDAWGADECFPTISASSVWNLRDHGDLWARTPEIFFATSEECMTGWQRNSVQFKRTLSSQAVASGGRILGAFRTQVSFPLQVQMPSGENTHRTDLTLLSAYASHALFVAEPGDRVEWSFIENSAELDSISSTTFTYNVLASQVFAADGNPIASKFYVDARARRFFATSLVRERLRVRIDVIQDASLPWVGIWWCHNGWGDGRPHSTVGIEPSNFPSDGPLVSFPHRTAKDDHKAQFLWVISKS